jgi:hypothetical protein
MPFHKRLRKRLARFERGRRRRRTDDLPVMGGEQINNPAAQRQLGPTTVKSRFHERDCQEIAWFGRIGRNASGDGSMPGLPGAQMISDTARSPDIFQAKHAPGHRRRRREPSRGIR